MNELVRILCAAGALLLASSPASAAFVAPCGPGAAMAPSCSFLEEPGGLPLWMDYTVAADGSLEQWDFWLETEDPYASISLTPPNQVDQYLGYRDYAGGPVNWSYGGMSLPYRWDVIAAPKRLTILSQTEQSWDLCSDAGLVGLCAVSNNVWGNGSVLTLVSDRPFTLKFSALPLSLGPVPEPATWAMMIVGFFGLGSLLRLRSKSHLALADLRKPRFLAS